MITKYTILFVAVLFLPLSGISGDLDKFWKEFEKAASDKDKKALKTMIYPLELTGEDVQGELINSIIADDETSTGDGAFSLRALQALRKSHMDKFDVVPDVLYAEFMRNPEMSGALKKVSQKDIMIFDHAGVKIIVFKPKKDWQLLFWEDLNNLIGT